MLQRHKKGQKLEPSAMKVEKHLVCGMRILWGPVAGVLKHLQFLHHLCLKNAMREKKKKNMDMSKDKYSCSLL